MSEPLFRQKSMEAMKSPESMDQYIKVARPGSWVLLSSVLCLLIGMVIWGIFGTIESSVAVSARVEGGTAVCSLSAADAAKLSPGMTVRIGEDEGTVWAVEAENGSVTLKIQVPDGAYDASIVTESIHPLSLILN